MNVHPFLPSPNPRIHSCARCGRIKRHPIHQDQRNVVMASLLARGADLSKSRVKALP